MGLLYLVSLYFPMKLFLHALIPMMMLALIQPEAIHAQRRKKINLSANFRIEQLAPRVWAAINNDQYGKAICNAGIVDLGNKTLVFDAFLAPSAAKELKAIARQLTRKPVTLVVDSHHHHDHIRGSQVFLPQATIISTTTTKNEIERVEPGEQEWEKKFGPAMLEAVRKRSINSNATDREELPFWIGYYEGVIEASDEAFIASPDVLFDDSLWIKGSKLSVKLVERRNGHTASDAVLLIPSLGIAFMGDLLCNGRHPWISDGDTKAWRESLKVFYEDSVYNTYLPGYGEVCGKEELKTLYHYLDDLQSMCDAAETDSAQSTLIGRPIPLPYRGWFCGRFYQPNLQYLISTAKARAKASE
jgi:cyclase